MPTTLSSRAPSPTSPPPRAADWAAAPVAVVPTPRLVVLAVVVGLVGDLAVRSGRPGLAAALLVVVTAGALLGSDRVGNPHARALILLAPVFGAWLAVRTSPWLVPVDAVAAFGLLVLGASLSRHGSVVDLPLGRVAARIVHAILHITFAPGLLRHRAPPLRRRDLTGALAVVRGVAVAAPVVLVLGALLASADVVFASLVDVDLGPGNAIAHGIAIGAFAWVGLGLLRLASAGEPVDLPVERRRLGATEATVVLLAVAALFATFVASSVITAAGGADHVLQTAGLTRAEYARSGFFQLLWVASLTIGGLLALASAVDLEGERGRRLRLLVATVVALTIPIVVVAHVRLDVYRDAYGWTMLRLVSTVGATWLGLVLVLLGIALAGPSRVRGRGWFVPGAAASALALLLAVNAVNPEALVARHNLTRPTTVAVDPAYLAELSDDAVPTIVELLPSLDPLTADEVIAAVGCPARVDDGWAGWNLGEARAERARGELCRG